MVPTEYKLAPHLHKDTDGPLPNPRAILQGLAPIELGDGTQGYTECLLEITAAGARKEGRTKKRVTANAQGSKRQI